MADPNRFLASVQLGVTLTTLLAGAFGAVTLSEHLRHALEDAGLQRLAGACWASSGSTLVITTSRLVVGELAPKRLALQRAQRHPHDGRARTGPAGTRLRPAIWLFSVSTNGLVRLLGGDPAAGRRRSPRRSCAGWSRPTRRSGRRSGG